jgi:hypothetical protein
MTVDVCARETLAAAVNVLAGGAVTVSAQADTTIADTRSRDILDMLAPY